MQNNIDKVDIVATNYAENDIDYSGIIASIAKGDLTLDGYKFLLRSVYKQGFKRGVERMKKSNSAAWIDYDANHGFPFTCRCGNCGYFSHIGDSNFCPECGRKMDLKFGSQEARNLYEKIAKHRIEMQKVIGLKTNNE